MTPRLWTWTFVRLAAATVVAPSASEYFMVPLREVSNASECSVKGTSL